MIVADHVIGPCHCCRPCDRTMEDLEIVYEELLHIKALSHLSTMLKRELATVLMFESHSKAGTIRESRFLSSSSHFVG